MSKNKQAENWVSMKEITQYLDVSRETVLQWINSRSMPASKVGRLWKLKNQRSMSGFTPVVRQTKTSKY